MVGNILKIIDFRDTFSSISLLKVTQVFEKMGSNEILEIRGTDPDIRQDLFKVLPKASYEIVRLEGAEGEGDVNRVQIRKCRRTS